MRVTPSPFVVVLFLTLVVFIEVRGQALSTEVVREGYKAWETDLSSATRLALQHLNKDKKDLKHPVHLGKVDWENTKVAQGIFYTLGLELDIGYMKDVQYELSFLDPVSEWCPLWGNLPSLLEPPSAPSTALSLANQPQQFYHPQPELAMTFRGPLEISIDGRMTELRIRTPKDVDVGFVEEITIASGVNVSITGFYELNLEEPINLNMLPVVSNDKLLVEVEDIPRINIIGRRVVITNASESETLKVRKTGSSELEILSGKEVAKNSKISRPGPYEISLNDSRLHTIQYAVNQLTEGNGASAPALRRLFSTKMEAVTSFFIPFEASEDGEITNWEAIVVQGINPKNSGRVVSVEKKNAMNEVGFEWSLLANGTLASTFANFIGQQGVSLRH